ncbi:MAG: dimethyl sulfoxide reductase anchor subunit family protein [Desulfitobacterium sp.]
MLFAEEWPLMSFTLLSQLAIGTFVILMLIKAGVGNKDSQTAKAINFGVTAVGPITVLALVFSVFHLGDPLGAPRSILNLGSSWLSREILTAGGFFILWLAYWYLARQGKENSVLGWLTALLGLIAVFSMASIYSSSVRPAWDNANTYIAFFGATIAMGVLGAAGAIAYGMRGRSLSAEMTKSLKTMGYIGAAAVILPLIYLPLFISGLKGGDVAAVASAEILTGSIGLLAISGLLLIVGIVILLYGLSKGGTQVKAVSSGTIFLALLLVLVGELMGRYLFYAIGVSPIIGG